MTVKKDALYVANTTGFVHVGDQDVRIERGVTLVHGDHALYKAAPLFFDSADDRMHPDIEQATAAPGEKRGA